MLKIVRMTAVCIIASALGFSLPHPAAAKPEPAYDNPFQNPGLSVEKRVTDLVSRLTLDEKVSLMHQYPPAIPRLGINAFKTGTEALHGVAWLGEATVFPQAVGLAHTWDPALVKRAGSAVGDEVRGFHHLHPAANGVNVWAPVVDLLRDPRWGRNEEGYSEDPFLTGKIASAYASGLKGDHPFYLKTVPTLKHFLGYNNETDRGFSSSSIDPRNLHEYYIKPFQTVISEKAAYSLMPAYNSINDKPAILSPLLKSTVKNKWAGKHFFIVSDAFDPSGIVNDHRYYDNHEEAHAHALKAGIDSFTDQGENPALTKAAISGALQKGLISEKDLDHALKNTFSIRFRTGEFDPDELSPYSRLTDDVINSPAHQKLAKKTAEKSIVLLKNSKQLLPFNPRADENIAVIGPFANVLYEDWYSGTMPYQVIPLDGITDKIGKKRVSFAEGIEQSGFKSVLTGKFVTADQNGKKPLTADSAELKKHETFDLADWGDGVHTLRAQANGRYVSLQDDGRLIPDQKQPNGWTVKETFQLEKQPDRTYAMKNTANGKYVKAGIDGTLTASADAPLTAAEKFEKTVVKTAVQEAVELAKTADKTVVFAGNNPYINGRETQDRNDIALPPAQEELIKSVTKANPNTVLVVTSSYPFALNWADKHVPAILYRAHGGQEAGSALAGILFGDEAPGGRLTQTWHASVKELPDMMDYDIIKGKRTYKYFDGRPLYPFGHGLSYTSFRYHGLTVSPASLKTGGSVTIRFKVTNTGKRKGDEVVQLYTAPDFKTRVKQPRKDLKGFQRITLSPAETKTVTFKLKQTDLAFWDVTREKFAVEKGPYSINIGSSSKNIRLTKRIPVHGEAIPQRNLRQKTKAENYDDYEGVRITEEAKRGGDAVKSVTENSWIAFRHVRLKGEKRFEAAVSSKGGGNIDIYLDRPVKGKKIGSLNVPDTSGLENWKTIKAQLSKTTGTRDVYFVFKGKTALDTFQFHR
ncbi:glycoside hydrolase family 3 C-terminal domain-containing protein [Bacillus glycinifermentans]|uniref:glycoside hydrolase family 3 C-terminal domain-containing protein n=1 Tax=Bacillus glycinifermentans TaxID=1664069 RepID=UPI002DBEE5F7|nr:glycoside hydrolase family 3 C-terminal domain-containing protein [Bacillus glycinifermentans]MEC3607620.1 glycoside hydrolase family 3 C-terminal domain-containing protein [Bacillus glycinifermentans]